MRISDWSSDVCSSDLVLRPFFLAIVTQHSGVDESRCGRQLRLHGQQMDLLRRACRGQLGDHETDGGERRVRPIDRNRSEEHTSELQSLMRISYAVFCLKKKNTAELKHTSYYNTK